VPVGHHHVPFQNENEQSYIESIQQLTYSIWITHINKVTRRFYPDNMIDECQSWR
jgi:hypothetical protein